MTEESDGNVKKLLERRKILLQKRKRILSAQSKPVSRSFSTESIIENSESENSPDNPPKRQKKCNVVMQRRTDMLISPSDDFGAPKDTAAGPCTSLITCEDLGIVNFDITIDKYCDTEKYAELDETVLSALKEYDVVFAPTSPSAVSGEPAAREVASAPISPFVVSGEPATREVASAPASPLAVSGETATREVASAPASPLAVSGETATREVASAPASPLAVSGETATREVASAPASPLVVSGEPATREVASAPASPLVVSGEPATREVVSAPASPLAVSGETATREVASAPASPLAVSGEIATREVASAPASPLVVSGEPATREVASAPASPLVVSGEPATREVASAPASPLAVSGETATREVASAPASPLAVSGETATREVASAPASPLAVSGEIATREVASPPASPSAVFGEPAAREVAFAPISPFVVSGEPATREVASAPASPLVVSGETATREVASAPTSPLAESEEPTTREVVSTPTSPLATLEELEPHNTLKISKHTLPPKTHSSLCRHTDDAPVAATSDVYLSTSTEATSSVVPIASISECFLDLQSKSITDEEEILYVIEVKGDEENIDLGLPSNTDIDVELRDEESVMLATPLFGGDANESPNTSEIAEGSIFHTNTKDVSNESGVKTKKPTNKRKLRHGPTCFLDFVSDEENFIHNEDFSSGSSDLWSEKDSDQESEENLHTETKKKMKRKKKHKKHDKHGKKDSIPVKKQKLENKNKSRKLLRQKGFAYETSSGNTKDAKKVHENPCVRGKCPRDCFNVSEEKRQSIFNYFWNLDNERKKDWIMQCAVRMPIKRKKTTSVESKKSYTYEYYINEDEGRKQVCQQFIIKTLDISQKRILYTVGNIEEGLAKKDKRTRTAINIYDEKTKNFAKTYIEGLPVLPSHYSRKKSTKLYLPQEYKNTTNLYRLYAKKCEEAGENHLSERLFTNLFRNEYNISFHVLKKDKCSFCMKYENKQDLTKEDKANKIAHDEEKVATYERFIFHQELKTPNNTTLTASFDLQKVLNTPHGESMLLYYSRKYAVYNMTVYESTTQNGYCYTWGESQGKRGSCEIATCIFKYLQEVDKRGIKNLILYCDSCCGQNKNRVMLSVLKYFLSISTILEMIQINFLLPGHTYMPVDSMHAVIEREVRKIIVYSPSQWPSFMELARKRPRPYVVSEMEYHDFIDWEKIAEETFTKITLKNKDLKLRNIRIATFKKKEPEKMELKYSMRQDAEKVQITLSVKDTTDKSKSAERKRRSTKGKGVGKGKKSRQTTDLNSSRQTNSIDNNVNLPNLDKELQPLYKKRLPVSMAKYNDLKKLCTSNIIPARFHHEYLSLETSSTVRDGLNETDEEDSSNEN